MSLTLEIIFNDSTPASQHQLGPGESVTLGRSPTATISVPNAPYLSGLHCSIENIADGCLIRDLKSTNGTFVDGIRVQEVVIRPGQLILAGSVTIFPFVSEDAVDASKLHVLLRLFSLLDASLFCLVDAACSREILDLIRQATEERQCLYDGNSAHELEAYAPYLIELPRGSALLKILLSRGWGKGWASYFTSRANFKELRHHFRRFIFVNLENSGEVYFRFYDPRVLRVFLPTCNAQDVVEFFGPVDSWILEGEPPVQSITISQQNGHLNKVDRVILGKNPS
jgi:hypothetical protein